MHRPFCSSYLATFDITGGTSQHVQAADAPYHEATVAAHKRLLKKRPPCFPLLLQLSSRGRRGRVYQTLRPPEVQQPEILNEIFRASVLSAVRWSRQTEGLHDVMPKPYSSCVIGAHTAGLVM